MGLYGLHRLLWHLIGHRIGGWQVTPPLSPLTTPCYITLHHITPWWTTKTVVTTQISFTRFMFYVLL